MENWALRNKNNGLYVSETCYGHMVLSKESAIICFFNEENAGEKIFSRFRRERNTDDYYTVTRQDYEIVEISLP